MKFPCHHNLEHFLDEWLEASGLEASAPMFALKTRWRRTLRKSGHQDRAPKARAGSAEYHAQSGRAGDELPRHCPRIEPAEHQNGEGSPMVRRDGEGGAYIASERSCLSVIILHVA